MEDFRLTAMRQAAKTVEEWRTYWGDRKAEEIVIRHCSGIYADIGPEFRSAYLTAFGR